MKVYSTLLILLYLVSCAKTSKPLIVYLDPRISDQGLKIWGIPIRYWIPGQPGQPCPDIWIEYSDQTPLKKDGSGKLLAVTYWNGKSKQPKPILIRIAVNNPVMLAHEIGHCLGYFDNRDWDSIMFPRNSVTNWPLHRFKEFKNLTNR